LDGQGPSHNHHFLGGIGQWLQSDLIGLQQGAGTAYSHPIVFPRIVNHTDLRVATGRWETPRGVLSVSWRAESEARVLSLNVSFPPNTAAATVVFPCAPSGGGITEGTALVWSGGAFKPGAAVGVDAASLRVEDGLVAFRCASGTYEFKAACVA
jgi:hypothetical protein